MDAAGLGNMPKLELHPHQSQPGTCSITEQHTYLLALALPGSALPLVPSALGLAFGSGQRRRRRRDDRRLDHPLQVWRAGDRRDRRDERAL